jgi:kynurenine formamidase
MIGLVAGLLLSWPAFALDIGEYRLVDLTHPYNSDTLYWPTSPSEFEKKELAAGETEGGWFYSAYSICTPEHGGTHLDAPRHFAADGYTADRMPLDKLIAPAVVIDVSRQAADDRNYRLSADDVRAFEKKHGRIEPGTIVLMRSGWSRHWPDAMGYLGDDTPGDASKLEFPGYGENAARLLVEDRQVAMLGVDTASIDYGKSKDFVVHRIAAAGNVGGLENLTSVDQLPPNDFVIVALPMKIEGGSGGPARVVAMVPK